MLHDNGAFLSGYAGCKVNMGCHTEVAISPDSQSIPQFSSVLHAVTLSSWWTLCLRPDVINYSLLFVSRSPTYTQMFFICGIPLWTFHCNMCILVRVQSTGEGGGGEGKPPPPPPSIQASPTECVLFTSYNNGIGKFLPASNTDE